MGGNILVAADALKVDVVNDWLDFATVGMTASLFVIACGSFALTRREVRNAALSTRVSVQAYLDALAPRIRATRNFVASRSDQLEVEWEIFLDHGPPRRVEKIGEADDVTIEVFGMRADDLIFPGEPIQVAATISPVRPGSVRNVTVGCSVIDPSGRTNDKICVTVGILNEGFTLKNQLEPISEQPKRTYTDL